MFYCDLYSKIDAFWMLFLHFKLCQLAIFEPVDLGKGYVHPLKSLKMEKLTHYLKKGVGGENIWRTLQAAFHGAYQLDLQKD